MKYGIPTEQFINDFSDIEYDYTWFDNIDDAIAFGQSIANDITWNPIDEMINPWVPNGTHFFYW